MPIQKNNLDLLFLFAKRSNRPLLLDGAMGSLLQQRGIKSHPHLWMSLTNITQPDEVVKIHKAYVKAGADIITTNTFRTNPVSVKRSNVKIKSLEFVKNVRRISKINIYELRIKYEYINRIKSKDD